MIDRGHYFIINPNATSIVLGHSHPECAFNDSLIDNCKNLAQSAESYFFTYNKLKKIIQNNPQVNTVFVEFTNNQLSKKMDDLIWGDEYFSFMYPKYAAIMNTRDCRLLLSHNALALLHSLPVTLKKNFLFLVKNKKDYINEMGWGGYWYLVKSKTDSLINAIPNASIKQEQPPEEMLTANVGYLQKIVQLCKQHAIKIYLVRSPMHSRNTELSNEAAFKKVARTTFSDIDLLDFKDFPLSNSEFADPQHVNYKGAKLFSLFFNSLIKDGLLNKPDKQQVVNTAIAMLNKRPVNVLK